MDLQEVKRKLAVIENTKGDDERAHGMADDLYHDLAVMVANCADQAVAEIAAEVLKVEEIKFSRWCG
jgi:hypothetical protein